VKSSNSYTETQYASVQTEAKMSVYSYGPSHMRMAGLNTPYGLEHLQQTNNNRNNRTNNKQPNNTNNKQPNNTIITKLT